MRKIWTKIATFALLAVVMVSFTACSLFTTDLDYKYSPNIMVASIANHDDLTVSRKELYNAYLQWGYQYASYMEHEELLTALAESVLNNKILRKLSLEKYGPLQPLEEAKALKQTFDAVDAALRSEVYEILDEDDPDKKTEDASEEKVTYTPYEKSILVDLEGYATTNSNGDWVEVNQPTFSLNLESYRAPEELTVAEYKLGYAPTFPAAADEKTQRQAIRSVIRNLQNLEKGFRNLTAPKHSLLRQDNTWDSLLLPADDRAVLDRELNRMYEQNETSALVERLQVAYELGIDLATNAENQRAWQEYLTKRGDNFEIWAAAVNADTQYWNNETMQATNGRNIAQSRANEVVSYYQDLVKNDMFTYSNISSEKDLESAIMSHGLDGLYYIPNGVARKMFTVSHILVGFTDEQSALYKELVAERDDPELSRETNWAERLRDLKNETMSNDLTAQEIYDNLQNALAAETNLQKRYDLFRDYIYQYNTDPGMQDTDHSKYEYLMSVNGGSGMVTEFEEASIALFNDGKGERGTISNLVWTEFGAHIIMYTRRVSDFIYTGERNALESDYADTLFAPIKAYDNKTYFDLLAEKVNSHEYSKYQTLLLDDFKKQNPVTICKKSAFKKFI